MQGQENPRAMEGSPAGTSSKQAKSAPEGSVEITHAAKYREYERDYLRWIHYKYFSDQILGSTDPVYEHSRLIEGSAIRASKNTPFKSFAEPTASIESTPTENEPSAPTTGRKKGARR